MFHFQRNAGHSAVSALVFEFLEQVLPYFVTGEFSLLITDSGDHFVLYELCVELYIFVGQCSDRSQLLQPADNGLDVVNTA